MAIFHNEIKLSKGKRHYKTINVLHDFVIDLSFNEFENPAAYELNQGARHHGAYILVPTSF